MSYFPGSGTGSLVDLLSSQTQTVSFGSFPSVASLGTEASNPHGVTPAAPKQRRKWTQEDDIVLISSWLNTSKDAVVGNEQRAGTFWDRVTAYYAASPHAAGCLARKTGDCKQRWHKINDHVSKFCGSYAAATRQKSSGQNEVDVLKQAHHLFFIHHNKKFTLEHAWRELRYDHKWRDITNNDDNKKKKRKNEEGEDSVPSEASGSKRPPGVKAAKAAKAAQAAKASGKKPVVHEIVDVDKYESMWTIKQQDLAAKERLSKTHMLENLLARQDALADYEEVLKKKLISDLWEVHRVLVFLFHKTSSRDILMEGWREYKFTRHGGSTSSGDMEGVQVHERWREYM
ncbi:glutathione S-transferase T3-like [Raphanus sativus]|uniref:Glutathione S-transferase T3-like n=1 Tax=Raphanus sativus TaxID=3726 RepID=A0A9W3CV62_RAPSA|nr:glutathione S-transferase T3-like [Raphanus sativus]